MKNRIEQYFDSGQLKNMNKFECVQFEKFNPEIIQYVTKHQSSHDDYDLEDGDDEENFNEFDESSVQKISQKIVMSQDSQMIKTINLWIGHCNKSISAKTAFLMSHVKGVESLDIITRYRFRVGIGKLFKEAAVKEELADVIKREGY